MMRKEVFLVFIFFINSFLFSQSYVDRKLSYVNGDLSYVDNSLTYVDSSLSYVDKELTYIIEDDTFSRQRFIDSFADSLYLQEMRREHLELCYERAIAKFGIGTVIVATTWLVAFVVPGGAIYQFSVITIAKAATAGALSGGPIGGVTSAGVAYLQGKRGDELIYETVNGTADGVLIGAITGVAEGAVRVGLYAKDMKKISDAYTIFANRVFDSSGNMILDASKLGKDSIEKLAEILSKQGDDALKALEKIVEKNPKDLSLAIEYLNAKGLDATYDILKWKGRIPSWVTKEVIECAEKISSSSLKSIAEELKKLPGIKLTVKELDKIRQDPAFLKEIVEKYTEKSFKDGYLEFFVRLAKKNPKQMEEIWNYSKAVRDFIKNEGIRVGGVHEWLLCENFCDFLINPKWRKDGAYLCELLAKLTQSTDSVIMENIEITLRDGSKEFYKIWSHLLESQTTLGNSSNPRSIIHNLIRDVVENSNSSEELIVNLEKMVKENFSEETYRKFSEALTNCLA